MPVEDSSDVLRSPDGTFTCGFNKISQTASIFSIWYSNTAEKTVVWSANHLHPVCFKGSRVTLDPDGRMAVEDYDGRPVWENNVSSSSSNALRAQLLDTGNLVVKGQDWASNAGEEVEMVLRSIVRMLTENMMLEGSQQLWLVDFIDSRLNGQFDELQARTMVKLAMSCLEDDTRKRPTMENLAQMLLSVDEDSGIMQ
ncbi:hypothetical protein ZWY2020_000154 [Hordeum vulgare]|nr:hypothetical protein ZWY2020_000154 [Hordeum vulgare]